MSINSKKSQTREWPTLSQLPRPVKALISCIIFTMMIAMTGALGQIIVHDIIPTFFDEPEMTGQSDMSMEATPDSGVDLEETSPSSRGDLFADDAAADETPAESNPFYKTEQFVWTLKWTHIHLFGMNMIFIFMGAIAIFLDASTRWKTLLVVLPFAGVLIDIASMWLKAFVSPVFFWLHIPGGMLFGLCFFYVSIRALYEMWWARKNYAHG